MRQLALLPLVLSVVCVAAEVVGPLSKDFQLWLEKHNYNSDDFERLDLGEFGSFGGKSESAPNTTQVPVVFFHGNSDSALKSSLTATGWANSISYFLSKGYTTADLYATSWGDNNDLEAPLRKHDCKTLVRLRRFLEAVISYTMAQKVSIVSHSMGVTLARKIIKGGNVIGDSCDLGKPLSVHIDVFVGLSGGNYGLCNCEGEGTLTPTCNIENGLWPGNFCGMNVLTCGMNPLIVPCSGVQYSSFLMELNNNEKEADHMFSAWSRLDDVIMYTDMVWGRPTSLIPQSNGKKVYTAYTHMQTKELTAADQFVMVNGRRIP